VSAFLPRCTQRSSSGASRHYMRYYPAAAAQPTAIARTPSTADAPAVYHTTCELAAALQQRHPWKQCMRHMHAEHELYLCCGAGHLRMLPAVG
jgi:hypothetical protein